MPCSRMNVSSIPIEYSKFKDKESVSVGEFIGVFSEAVTFTANQKETNVSNLKHKYFTLFANCFKQSPFC